MGKRADFNALSKGAASMPITAQRPQPRLTPSQLRDMFGANLRVLCKRQPSVSAVCRELGINRTQFNRYLSGESFPRPDVLYRICTYFEVDARILLEPLEDVDRTGDDILSHPEIRTFLSGATALVSEDLLPSGFYRFSRRSFTQQDKFIVGLVLVYRKGSTTFIRGHEPRDGMVQQGLPTDPRTREFRGVVLTQEDGVAALIARRGSLTCSFNFLSRVSSFQHNFWVGYVTRTMRETVESPRMARLVYEYLGTDCSAVLATARGAGLNTADQLVPYHKTLLRPDEPVR